MAKQNIFDNEVFFEGYAKIRENEGSANNLFEIPVMYSMLPDLSGKSILDLGCGYGEHCVDYIKKGAKRVVGIDISEKMLEVARKENADPHIEYINIPMEDLVKIDEKFDMVLSSLALHYIEDFSGVLKNIHRLLYDGGVFIFSQEHPFNTCYTGDIDRWTRDESGNKLYVNLKMYNVEGERSSSWFVDGVLKYHRTFSTIMNSLTDAGFMVERVEEPKPTEELLLRFPQHRDLYHKPDFLIVKAKKI